MPIFLFLLIAEIGIGQSSSRTKFSNWQKQDGLPNNNINAVIKDDLGFLWIATNDGLCRYDGPNSFKVFRQPNDENSNGGGLESNKIRSLFKDSKGYLWIGTLFGGITRYHPPTNDWTTYRHDSTLENSLSNDEVLTIFEDSKNQLWIGTEDGLNLFDPETGTFQRFKLNRGKVQGTAVITILEDLNGWIWVGTWAGGLHLMLEDSEGLYHEQQVRHFESPSGKLGNNVWDLYQDNEGRYWIGTHGGGLLLMEIPGHASNFVHQQNWDPKFHIYSIDVSQEFSLKSNAIQAIFQDRFNNLWVGTTHGLHKAAHEELPPLEIIGPKPEIKFECFLANPEINSSICGINIMDLFEDEHGMIWIATTDGLSQYNWNSNHFKSIPFLEDEMELAFSPSFIIDSSNHIWLGAQSSGLHRLKLDESGLIETDEVMDQYILGKSVTTLHLYDNRYLYVGTELGITLLNINTYETIQYPTPDWVKTDIPEFSIKAIHRAKDGTIWFGTSLGLFRIDSKTKNYTIYTPEMDSPKSLVDNSVNFIIQDSQGALWVSTYNGLSKIEDPEADPDEIVFDNFLHDPNSVEKGPVSNKLVYMKEFKGYLYLGSTSGIGRYNFSTGKFELTEASKYKFWVRCIEEGINGDLWIGNNEGIMNYNPEDHSIRLFDKKDGLKNTHFQMGCNSKDTNGNIYFAYINGFTYFSPKSLIKNEVPPPVYFTEVEKTNPNGTQMIKTIYKNQIDLNYNDYRLSINFAALNYNRGDKNIYRYRLLGFDDQWKETKFGNPIVYTNLEPQKYQLEIQAANNDGIWNRAGNKLLIVRHPAFWETWWFTCLAIFSTIGVVFYLFKRNTEKIRKKNETLEGFNVSLSKEIAHRRKVERQLYDYNKELKRSNSDLEQFAYVASHDLKEPLRVIGSFSGLLSRRYNKKLDKEALDYINFIEDGVQRMSNVINSLLTYSTVGRKDGIYESFDLKTLLESKVSDLAQSVKEKNALIQVYTLPTIVGQKEQIGMVFFNLIHNAIKFNEREQPIVMVREEPGDDEHWKFSVQDNGIGIAPEYKEKVFGIFKRLHGNTTYEGTGIGLSVCQKIIHRHQGAIWFESKEGQGTKFYLTIKKIKIPVSPKKEPVKV